MRKYMLILALIIPAMLCMQCNDSNFMISVDADLGETIEIRYNQVIRIESEDLTFGLTDQIVESRCPTNAYCFWAGQVEAQFWFKGSMPDTLYSTAIYSPGGISDRMAGIPCYTLIIERVEPYPQDFGAIPLDQYRLRVRVEAVECNSTSNEAVRVQFSELNPAQLQKDAFELNNININSDILTVNLSRSGGCVEHEYILYMNPVFKESNPVQADLYLYHNGFNDYCDAWITDSINFDLTPIAELYKAYYGEYDNIILNVYRYFSGTPGGKLSVIYTP